MKRNQASPFRALILVVCLLGLVFCVSTLLRDVRGQTAYSYADIRDFFLQEQVDLVYVEDDTLTLTLKKPVDGKQVVRYSLYSFELFYEDFDDIIQEQYAAGILRDYEYPDSPTPSWLGTVLTWVVILVVVAFLWYFLFLRHAQGGGGGGGLGAPDSSAKPGPGPWPRPDGP